MLGVRWMGVATTCRQFTQPAPLCYIPLRACVQRYVVLVYMVLGTRCIDLQRMIEVGEAVKLLGVGRVGIVGGADSLDC